MSPVISYTSEIETDQFDGPETVPALSFRSVAADALRRLHESRSREGQVGGIRIPVPGANVPGAIRPASEAIQKVGVKFHLRETDLSSIPLEGADVVREEVFPGESRRREDLSSLNSRNGVGIRFCWIRGQGAVSEEFVSWTRNHGEIRGTLLSADREFVEFETTVRVPSGARWHARAVTSSGEEVDLTGIVCGTSRPDESTWQVSCRLTERVGEAELRALGQC